MIQIRSRPKRTLLTPRRAQDPAATGGVVTPGFVAPQGDTYRFWVGERECANKVSIYRGPILLTYDRRFNAMDPDQIPTLDAANLSERVVQSEAFVTPMLLVEYAVPDGKKVALCDFASAGADGSPYKSWLLVRNAVGGEFSVQNPRRT